MKKAQRSGRTLSAETKAVLDLYLHHSETAMAALRSLLDGDDASTMRARLRRIENQFPRDPMLH